MNKSQFYLSQCADAAAKSTMCFNLGAVLVKGGKIISTGYNHHRPHYDGSEVSKHGHRKPVSMHAEMHAIFNATGMSPAFKTQSQNVERRVPQRERRTGVRPAKGEAVGWCLSGTLSGETSIEARQEEEASWNGFGLVRHTESQSKPERESSAFESRGRGGQYPSPQ
jgi:Cytidine and deoxycytidylate deaminase zinc-binding region